jgi:hypothetical protein
MAPLSRHDSPLARRGVVAGRTQAGDPTAAARSTTEGHAYYDLGATRRHPEFEAAYEQKNDPALLYNLAQSHWLAGKPSRRCTSTNVPAQPKASNQGEIEERSPPPSSRSPEGPPRHRPPRPAAQHEHAAAARHRRPAGGATTTTPPPATLPPAGPRHRERLPPLPTAGRRPSRAQAALLDGRRPAARVPIGIVEGAAPAAAKESSRSQAGLAFPRSRSGQVAETERG